jgi:glutamyl-tRNA synthetase
LQAFDHTAVESALRTALIDSLGLKPRLAFGPVRAAVTGSRISPPLFESIELLGRQSTLARIAAALAELGKPAFLGSSRMLGTTPTSTRGQVRP